MIGNLCRLLGLIWVTGVILTVNVQQVPAGQAVSDLRLVVDTWQTVLSGE